MVSGTDIRKPFFSGSFYPAGKEELLGMLGDFFGKTKEVKSPKKIKALIVPHAGYVYSGQTAAWGYRQLLVKENDYQYILIGPSHQSFFSGLVNCPDSLWETPLGEVYCHQIKRPDKEITINDKPHMNEHCLEVQLPFLQYINSNKKPLNISCFLTGSQVDAKKSADYFLENYPDAFFIFSSDLSHYLPEGEARSKDKKTVEAILKDDQRYFETEENTACGMMGILILMKMAKRQKWQSELIYYDTSASFSGDRSGVVGYAAIGFYG